MSKYILEPVAGFMAILYLTSEIKVRFILNENQMMSQTR